MAFFKFRWPGQTSQDEQPARRSRSTAQAQAESVETMRRRARHRLMGAAVLVLVGVIGFPLLFDTQPRPIPVDIPIDIPDRNKAPPLAGARAPEPAATVAASLSEGEEVAPARPVAKPSNPLQGIAPPVGKPEPKPDAKPEPKPESKPPAKPEARPDPKPEPRPEPKPEPKPAPRPEPKPEPKPAIDEAARARALLEGRAPAAAAKAEEGRFIVQVGAFADDAKAREVRGKLERAGLKTYTHVADTKDGKRTRVRVGPFASRADADKAAARIKALDLPAAILTL